MCSGFKRLRLRSSLLGRGGRRPLKLDLWCDDRICSEEGWHSDRERTLGSWIRFRGILCIHYPRAVAASVSEEETPENQSSAELWKRKTLIPRSSQQRIHPHVYTEVHGETLPMVWGSLWRLSSGDLTNWGIHLDMKLLSYWVEQKYSDFYIKIESLFC